MHVKPGWQGSEVSRQDLKFGTLKKKSSNTEIATQQQQHTYNNDVECGRGLQVVSGLQAWPTGVMLSLKFDIRRNARFVFQL